MVYSKLNKAAIMIHYSILAFTFVYDAVYFVPLVCVAALNLALKRLSKYLMRPRDARYLMRPHAYEIGMPSGHCQVYWAYAVCLMLRNPWHPWILLLSVVGALVGVERLHSKKHTLLQVFVGSVVGILSGIYIHNNI